MGSTRAVGAGGSSSARRERSAPSSRRRSALLRSNAASSAPLTMRTAHGNEASKGQHRSAKMQAFSRDWQRRVAVDGPLQKRAERAEGGSRSMRTSLRGAACTPSPQLSTRCPGPSTTLQRSPTASTDAWERRGGLVRAFVTRCRVASSRHATRGVQCEPNAASAGDRSHQRIPSACTWFCSSAPKVEADARTTGRQAAPVGTAGDCGIARSRPKEGAEDGGDAQQTEVSTWTVAPDRCEKAVEGSRKSCGAADAAIVLVRHPPRP